MWYWDSPIGPIYIKYIPKENLYGMEHNGVIWEACDTPQAEADNIYMHATGCYEWDSSEYEAPMDLSGWERIQ